MNNIYLLLGSNLGDSKQHLQNAIAHIAHEVGVILKISSVYKTAAWGNTQQPDFLNQVLLVSSPLSPQETLRKILTIETTLGRVRDIKWEARVIDIDILFYNDACINETNLIVPHPYLHQRNFTLIPLSEIAPDFYHPVLKKTVAALCEMYSDNLQVFKMPE